MAEVTVTQLAETTNTTVERLLQQLKEAGLSQTDASDLISEEEKQALLAHIKSTHGETEAEAAPKKITLKRRTLSTLKTGGSSGRGRTVNVEVRKKRTYVRKAESEAAESPEEAPKTAAPAAASAPAAEPEVSAEELAAEQAKAKEEALRRAAHDELLGEANRRRDEAAKKAAEEEQKAKEEAEKKAQDAAAEQARKAAEDKKKDTEESRVSSRKDKRDRRDLDDKDSREKRSRQGGRKQRIEELSFGDQDELLADETGGEKTLGLSQSRPRKVARPVRQRFQAPTEEQTREVEIGENITVAQLSQRMSVKATDVIKTLMSLGVMANINQTVDQDTATLVVEEFGHTVKLLDADAVETALGVEMELDGESVTRAPVVTVMGHVDHGKTSLLDYIRNRRVATGEAGGITQHIGAYRVPTKQGEICFIDTPGHAAFTAMRARGANSTDIVILVVAADDGVLPQTEEAIQHAKNAGAPMVVAINKIDKEGADPDRAKNGLAAKDVIPEDWGGDTQFIPVSALTGQGIDDLLEAVLLQAELMELKAVEEGPANGVVVESELDKGKGPVATLLVQNGTLKQGDIIVAGQQFGRARAITGDDGKPVKLAGPSTPVSMLGLDGPPSAGDTFTVVKDEKRAREVALFRKEKADSERLATPAASLDNLLASFGDTKVNYLNVVVKADVKGSLEAIVSALNEIGNDEVKVNVVYSGVGGIAEHDVNFAITSGAVIFGFNVRADSAARKLVERDGLDLRYYKVIYDLVDDVRDALTGMLAPELREEIVGIAEVRDVFQSKKLGAIAGCMVIEGTVYRDKKIRVLRDNIVIFEGELESLRHFKDEVESARNGTECGIGVKSYNDVKVGDQIEVFDSREIAREL